MAEQLVYSAGAKEGTVSLVCGDEMRYDHYQVSVTLPIQKKKREKKWNASGETIQILPI